MVKSVNSQSLLRMSRPDTTGVLASKPASTSIFASAKATSPASIFGSFGGSTETSGACACGSGGSSGGGGSTVAVA